MSDSTLPKLAGLPLLRQNLDAAFTAFRCDPTPHNRAILEVALSTYQIALANKSANEHHVRYDTQCLISQYRRGE